MTENQLEFFDLSQYTSRETGFNDWEIDVGEWEEFPLPMIKNQEKIDSDRPQSIAISSDGENSPSTPQSQEPQYSQEDYDLLITLPARNKEFKRVLKEASIITLLVAKEYLSQKSRGNKTRLKLINRRVHVLEWQLEITGFEGIDRSIPSSITSHQGDLEALPLLGNLPQTLKLPLEGNPHRGNFQVLTSVVPQPQSWDDLGTTAPIFEDGENPNVKSSREDSLSQTVSSSRREFSLANTVPAGESPSEIPKRKQERVRTDAPEEGLKNLNSPQNPCNQGELTSSPISEVKAPPKSRKLGRFLLVSYQPSRLIDCPYWYLRLVWREGEKMKTLHIPGGNADSEKVKERVAILERAVKSGLDKQSIIELVKSWRKPRGKKRKSKRSKKK